MKEIIFNNLGLKILSLFLAIVSWFAIRETISFEVTVPDIPLEIKTAEGWAVLHQSEAAVRVVFRGSQEDIRFMDQKQIKGVIDLSANTTPGSKTVLITPAQIKGIRGIRAIQVEPQQLAISLDRESEKKVPVKSRTAGKPLSGEVEELICEPAVVLLRGPAQQLEPTEWVYTEPIDVDGRIESFAKRCRVLPPSKDWTPRIEPAEVQVKVVISTKTETLEWKDVPVAAVVAPGTSFKFEITPGRVKVGLTGSAEALEGLKAAPPRAFVDCTDLDPSLTYDLAVNIHLPPGRNVVAVADPPFVHIASGSEKGRESGPAK